MAEMLTQEGIVLWAIPLFFVLLLAAVALTLLVNARKQNQQLQQQLTEQQQRADELRERAQYAESQLQTLRATAMQERRNADDKLRLLQASEERLTQQFENLANKIFEQKSQGFQQQNQQTLSATLAPFKDVGPCP